MSTSTWASGSLPPLTICTYCQSEASFASAAELAVPGVPPSPTGVGVENMYVLAPHSGQVRFFEVHVWYDDSFSLFGDDGTEPAKKDSIDSSIQNVVQKIAYPANGDPQTMQTIGDAHQVAIQFVTASLGGSTIDADEVSNAPDSAIDLIGPFNGPAGIARLDLQAGVSRKLEGLWGQAVFGATELAQRLAGRLIGGDGYIDPMSRITLEFANGTSIELEITNVSSAPNGSINVDVAVIENSGLMPDGRAIPVAGAQFSGREFSDPPLFNDVFDLARRLGLDLTGLVPDTNCTRVTFVFIDGVLAEIRCR